MNAGMTRLILFLTFAPIKLPASETAIIIGRVPRPKMNKDKPKIFLSYARDDFEIVKKIYNDLKSFGLDIWLDKISILAGQNWKVAVQKAIRKSNYFLAILSKNSVSNEGYVQKELRIALDMLE